MRGFIFGWTITLTPLLTRVIFNEWSWHTNIFICPTHVNLWTLLSEEYRKNCRGQIAVWLWKSRVLLLMQLNSHSLPNKNTFHTADKNERRERQISQLKDEGDAIQLSHTSFMDKRVNSEYKRWKKGGFASFCLKWLSQCISLYASWLRL